MSDTKGMLKVRAALTPVERGLFLSKPAGAGKQARRLSPAEEAAIVRLVDAGHGYLAIADGLRLSRNTVVPAYERATGKTAPKGHRAHADPETRARVARLVAEGRLTDTEIARMCGVTRATVYRYRRPRANGRITSWPSGVPLPVDTLAERATPPAAAVTVVRPPAPTSTPRERLAAAQARLAAIRERAEANLNGPPTAPAPGVSRTPYVPLRVRPCIPQDSGSRAATWLESKGWRAACLSMGDRMAVVEVRDLRQRGHPLVATLRTPDELRDFLASCGRGLAETVLPQTAGRPIYGRGASAANTKLAAVAGDRWPPRAHVSDVARGAIGHDY